MIAGTNSVCNGTAIKQQAAGPYLLPLLASSYPTPKLEDEQLVHDAVLLKVRRNPLLCFRHAHSAVVPRRHAAGKSRGCSSRVHNVHKSNLYGTFTSVCVCHRLLASSLNVMKQICVCLPTRLSEQPRLLVRPSRVLPSRVVVTAPP